MLGHRLIAETSKFHYICNPYGKMKHSFKDFSYLKKKFINVKIEETSSHTKAQDKRLMEIKKNYEAEQALKRIQAKYKGVTKLKEEEVEPEEEGEPPVMEGE